MHDNPLTPTGVIVILLIGFLGIVFSLVLAGRRKLTMSYAIVWVVLFAGMSLLIAVPPLLRTVTLVLGSSETLGAMRLLALATIVAFLIFFSVKVSVLTNRFEEMVQRMALVDYELRERINRRDPADGASNRTPQDPRA